jgi:WXG100 family type VII secretion target
VTGAITYNYPALDQGVQVMRRANNQISDETNNLIRDTKNLLAGFEGQASTAYDAAAQRISTSLNEGNAKLNTLSGKVASGAQGMGDSDRQAAASFG